MSTQLTLPSPLCASSLSCDQPLIYDTIAAAMCPRAAHKSTSSLLNTRAHQGYRLQCTAKKKCSPQQVTKDLVFLRTGQKLCHWVDENPSVISVSSKKTQIWKKTKLFIGFFERTKKGSHSTRIIKLLYLKIFGRFFHVWRKTSNA